MEIVCNLELKFKIIIHNKFNLWKETTQVDVLKNLIKRSQKSWKKPILLNLPNSEHINKAAILIAKSEF